MHKVLSNKKAISLFVLPTILLFAFLVFVPIVISLFYSFYSGMPGVNFEFCGLKNYIKAFSDRRLWTTVQNNLLYVLAVAVGQIILGFVIAMLLAHAVKRHQNLVRTLLFIPVVLPSVAVAQLFAKIYAITPQYGILNSLLDILSLQGLIHAWTGEVETAMGALIAMDIWKAFGMYVLLFYSAIIEIPGDTLEAAQIDGANKLQSIFYVQMPLLKNVLRMSLVMIMTACFKAYDSPVALTNGGPGLTTTMPSMYMYTTSFTSGNFGYGSVIALVILIECAVVTFVINKSLSKDNTQ